MRYFDRFGRVPVMFWDAEVVLYGMPMATSTQARGQMKQEGYYRCVTAAACRRGVGIARISTTFV